MRGKVTEKVGFVKMIIFIRKWRRQVPLIPSLAVGLRWGWQAKTDRKGRDERPLGKGL
jgi:hypothetical protein